MSVGGFSFEHRILKLEINDKFVTKCVELYGGVPKGTRVNKALC